MKGGCLLLVFILCQSIGALGQNSLTLISYDKEINLNTYLSAYIDTSRSLSLEQVMALPAKNFQPIPKAGLRTNVTNDVIWAKLTVTNPHNARADVIIDFVDPSLELIELYKFTESGLLKYATGTGLHPREKSVFSNKNNFLIEFPRRQTTQIYFKISSSNYMTVSARLLDDDRALEENMEERTFLGMFYGAVLILMVFNLLLSVITGMRVFFIYGLYIFTIAIFTGAADGFTPFYLHFLIEWTGGYQDMITATLSNILGLLFMLEFLQVRSWSKLFFNIVIGFVGFVGLSIVMLFFTYPAYSYPLLNIYGIIGLILMLTGGVFGTIRKIPQGVYYLLAYIFFGGFILIFILNLFRLVDYTFWVQYSIHFGYMLSIIILSYGLGVRIYELYKNYLLREQEKKHLIEQKRRELEVKVAERTRDILIKETNLRAILENTDSAIWLIDKQYRLIDYNNVFAMLCHEVYDTYPERNQSVLDITPVGMEKKRWRKRYNEALSGKRGVFIDQYHVAGKDHHFEIYTFPIANNGETTGVSIFARDISIRVNALDQLKEQNNALQKVNKELDSFVYSASHDLKAPLASIAGLISLVRREEGIQNRQPYYDMMERSIARLDQFISDIIDYSRNARLQKEAVSVKFEETIQEVFNDLAYMTDAGDIEKNVEVTQNVIFKTDPTRLKVIFRNLISNAIKYGCSHEGDNRIDVNCQVSEEKAIIKIQDYGPGISGRHRRRIFDMFYRADESGSGTGLGLYIVKETVDKLNGKIKLVTAEGEGSTFIVEIPNSE
ncbi:PAS domain-containing protein [Fulvivirga sp. 29W222]|uniref:histidine kinase n=1 Tax=Fulvivirga marina TaxID=2494733 RepID=A0A937KBI3_9BACT|nr:7TM diverse intracellular signaling domain-containing protein [Fulvivirga marina]MBL6446044.1 PAS domain-containing protein [Fulvivirga marina]